MLFRSCSCFRSLCCSAGWLSSYCTHPSIPVVSQFQHHSQHGHCHQPNHANQRKNQEYTEPKPDQVAKVAQTISTYRTTIDPPPRPDSHPIVPNRSRRYISCLPYLTFPFLALPGTQVTCSTPHIPKSTIPTYYIPYSSRLPAQYSLHFIADSLHKPPTSTSYCQFPNRKTRSDSALSFLTNRSGEPRAPPPPSKPTRPHPIGC